MYQLSHQYSHPLGLVGLQIIYYNVYISIYIYMCVCVCAVHLYEGNIMFRTTVKIVVLRL